MNKMSCSPITPLLLLLFAASTAGAQPASEGLLPTPPDTASSVTQLGERDRDMEEHESSALSPPESIDPSADNRRKLIEPKLEVTPWGGATWYRGETGAELGLRFAELAFWATDKVRLWAQYDNGLTLDNLGVSRGDRSAPAGYIGAFANYKEIYTTRVELGLRALPRNINQFLIRTEQVVALANGYAVKGGAWFGPRSDGRTEWILHAGAGLPLSSALRLDPTFFYARSGVPGQSEWRMLLSGEYAVNNGIRIAGGVAAGELLVTENDARRVMEEFIKISAPLDGVHRLHALVRNELVGNDDGITVLAVGFTWGFGER